MTTAKTAYNVYLRYGVFGAGDALLLLWTGFIAAPILYLSVWFVTFWGNIDNALRFGYVENTALLESASR